ncbi:MAG TPA: hypothetical protein VNP72_07835 [Longimicrobium sp.]|nr:hypothetical protein [Longimicrobium sp.]
MGQKKPWPTVIAEGDTGRFTREQIREAIRVVDERKARRAARAAAKNGGDSKATA